MTAVRYYCGKDHSVLRGPIPAVKGAAKGIMVRFAMKYDEDKVTEMVLALLYLTTFEKDPYGARAWKSHDWDALDRLHTSGYISDPKNKAKSVAMTPEGAKRSRELFTKYFERGR